MFPFNACLISGSEGRGFFRRSAADVITMPDVQYPHWNASASRKACCSGCRVAVLSQPFNGRDALACHGAHERDAGTYGGVVNKDRARAALPSPHTVFRTSEVELIAKDPQQATRQGRRLRVGPCR